MLICPDCGHTLEPIQINAAPVTDRSRLGTVVCVCFHCQMVYSTETVHDRTPYVAIARLIKLHQRTNLKMTLAAYDDLLAMLDPMIEWNKMTVRSPVSEACKHKLSSLHVYLTKLRNTIVAFRNNLKKSNP